MNTLKHMIRSFNPALFIPLFGVSGYMAVLNYPEYPECPEYPVKKSDNESMKLVK